MKAFIGPLLAFALMPLIPWSADAADPNVCLDATSENRTLVALADGSLLEDTHRGCLIHLDAKRSEMVGVVSFPFADLMPSSDVSISHFTEALPLRKGAFLIKAVHAPFSLPYQIVTDFIEVSAGGEASKSFGRRGVMSLRSKYPEYPITEAFGIEEAASGHLLIQWWACSQSTPTIRGECIEQYSSEFTERGRLLRTTVTGRLRESRSTTLADQGQP